MKAHKGKLTAKKRTRTLSEYELKKFLLWLPVSGFSMTQKNLLLFSLMTGCRTGEACNAQWKDIELSDAVWHIPDPKNNISRAVQLPKQAVSMLTELKRVNGYYPFQTASTRKPLQQKSLTETMWALRNPDKVAYNRKFILEQLPPEFLDDWTPHDLRRNIRTGLARLQCPLEVAEAVIGHVEQGVVGIYNQHKYESACREWLQKWCDYLEALVKE